MDKFFEVALFIIGFGSILFLTYITTRFIAGKSGKAMKGRYINIVETVSLGTDKRLHLVKAGEQYVMIASTSKEIQFLTTVSVQPDAAAEEDIQPENHNIFEFKALFEKYADLYKNKKGQIIRQVNPYSREKSNSPENPSTNDGQNGEKFRVNLERLKNITQKTDNQ